jgi:hypothetical protein
MTERANTMKTYLLRAPNTVEPQKIIPRHWVNGMFGRGMGGLSSPDVHSPDRTTRKSSPKRKQKMKRKRLARLHHTAAALGLKLVAAQ